MSRQQAEVEEYHDLAADVDLTNEEKDDIRSMWELFDKDGDGHITVDELAMVVRALGQNPTQKELRDMIAELDTNENGLIEKSEFTIFMKKELVASRGVDMSEEMMDAFRAIDKDGNGKINARELRVIMTSLGEQLSQVEVDEMIKEADLNGDGEIDYKEFVKVMTDPR